MPRKRGTARKKAQSASRPTDKPSAMITDEESGSEGDVIPSKAPAEPAADENGEDEDDDEDGEEEVYVVEDILSHMFDNGKILYEIKWQGYEKKSERTWEPEENLSGAKDILQAYHEKIGGKPTAPEKSSQKGKKRRQSALSEETPATMSKRGRKSGIGNESEGTPEVTTTRKNGKEAEWAPPKGSWEKDISMIETVEEVFVDEGHTKKERFVYVIWSNGRKSKHAMRVIHEKCPQKMLDYYAQHLYVFNPTTPFDPEGLDT